MRGELEESVFYALRGSTTPLFIESVFFCQAPYLLFELVELRAWWAPPRLPELVMLLWACRASLWLPELVELCLDNPSLSRFASTTHGCWTSPELPKLVEFLLSCLSSSTTRASKLRLLSLLNPCLSGRPRSHLMLPLHFT